MKRSEMLVVSLWDLDQVFWSRLEFSGEKAPLFHH